jgi:hypothetical protein
MPLIDIRTAAPNAERVVFCGPPRVGKTTLAQGFLGAPGMDSVVVVDSKHDDTEWIPFARRFGYVVSGDVADIRRHPRVIHRVDYRSLADRRGWDNEGTAGWLWTEALHAIFERQHTVVYFDEGMHTLPATAHLEARRLSTQGASLGLPLWLGTQAPLHVDTVALNLAEHFFGFPTYSEAYRKGIAQLRGVDAELLAHLAVYKHRDGTPAGAEFAYHRQGAGGWEIFGRIAPLNLRTTSGRRERAQLAEPVDNVRLTADEAP